MNSIKLHLIYLVMMCVGLCPRVAMAENGGHTFTYTEIPSVEISTDQEGNKVRYTIGLYSFNWAAGSQIQLQHPAPDAFLFAQRQDYRDWWFAVKYKTGDTNICSHSYDVTADNSYIGVVNRANNLEFFLNLELDKNGNPLESQDKNKIIQTLENKFKVTKIEDNDNYESSSAQPQDIKTVLSGLFDGCQEFLTVDDLVEKLQAEKSNDEVTAEKAELEKEISTLKENLEKIEKQLAEKTAELKVEKGFRKKLQNQLLSMQDPSSKDGSEDWLKTLKKSLSKVFRDQNFLKWLFGALIGLLMIVVIAGGFLLYRKVAQRFDEKMESYHADTQPQISDDMHNFKKQQADILAVVGDIYGELKKTPIANDERMAPNYQNTDAKQAETLLSAVQATQKVASDKLAAHIDQWFKNFISQYESGKQEYNEKLARLRLDYEKEKQSRLDMQTQLKHAEAGQEQERKRFLKLEDQVDDLKKKSARIYQKGGLKLSDEESQNLTSERLAELGSLYSKRPTVQQYGLAMDALKNRLGDPALADEPFFKAVGLNVLQAKLSKIHHFREFYETDEFSAYLVGHWKDNIQLIFRACLLLESYFQLDMQNPVLIDLQQAQTAARKLLAEHGLIHDDFQLPVPSHELERKFEVTVHGDIPADLANHAGFKDKVQALRRSGAHKVVCYVSRWGLSAQAGATYTGDLPGTVLKSLERLDPVVRGWGE